MAFTTSEYLRHDALGLAALVRRGEASAAEVLDAALARMDAVNPRINAVIADHRDRALAQLEAGVGDGPFAGVPFLLKDLHATLAGTVTTNGSAFFRDHRVDHDSELVARYRRAGLVIFGKTSTPEFGLTLTTEPALFGATRNPWHHGRSAGGSSGGSAAAVAAGIVPAAHASDGGGSIRVPASCCGLFGLKPTRGRNPAGPDRGDGWAGMSTEHVISRTVRDSAALLDATAGPDAGAPYFAPPPSRPWSEALGVPPGRLRIGLMTRLPDGAEPDAECIGAVRDAARLAEGFGHRVEEIAPRFLDAHFGDAFRVIIGANLLAAIRQQARLSGVAPEAQHFETITWMLAQLGMKATAADYADAVRAVHQVGRKVGACFEMYDVLLSPTLPDPPRPLGYFRLTTDTPELEGPKVTRATGFTSVFNASGNPAASLPLHWTADGLPVGVQIAGRYGDEATLFGLAAQYEQARPWAQRRPAP